MNPTLAITLIVSAILAYSPTNSSPAPAAQTDLIDAANAMPLHLVRRSHGGPHNGAQNDNYQAAKHGKKGKKGGKKHGKGKKGKKGRRGGKKGKKGGKKHGGSGGDANY